MRIDEGEDRFSFTPFTRHPFFTQVNRWIVERVICPGRRVIVDLGCGPGAVTQLILERLPVAEPPARVIGVDPSPSALAKARAADFVRVEERVRTLHSYDVPEVIAVPIRMGSAPYLGWLADATARGS